MGGTDFKLNSFKMVWLYSPHVSSEIPILTLKEVILPGSEMRAFAQSHLVYHVSSFLINCSCLSYMFGQWLLVQHRTVLEKHLEMTAGEKFNRQKVMGVYQNTWVTPIALGVALVSS